jgi:nucleotide-binding universal stress UspA family protein
MTILAVIDETERAKRIVPLAHDLATAYDERLVVLHVIPKEDYDAHKESMQGIPEFEDFSLSQEADSAADFARRVVEETVGAPNVDVEARGRVGDIADETLAEADSVDPRYLVVSGKRRSPTGKAIFGSAVQKVLLNADCPVVTKMSE